jgi:photosystem II stability/assembly factor-like uncharacterized protein
MKKLFFLVTITTLSIYSNITAQWIPQGANFPTDFDRGVEEIRIVDPNTVWAKVYNSTDGLNIQEFMRTTDGGEKWIPGTFNISNPNYVILNISPVSATTAWIAASTYLAGESGIWKTTDGGATWLQQNATTYQNNQAYLHGVLFFDANNGISFGNNTISDNNFKFEVYKTTDGGETWTAIPSIPSLELGDYGLGQFSIDKVATTGSTIWIATKKGNILKSSDMGSTWTKLKSPISDFSDDLQGLEGGILKFSDKNIGVIYGYKGDGNSYPEQKLYRTRDGGNTWSIGEPFPQPFRVINYIPGTTKMVGVGDAGTADFRSAATGYSNDDGKTWTILDSDILRANVISFFDENTGWTCGNILSLDKPFQSISKFNPQFLSVSNFNSNSKFSVSPIPTTGNIKLSSVKNTIGNVKIHNVLGKEVFNTKFNNLNNEVSIDLSTIDNGIYFLKATAQNGEVETIKIIKN